MLEQGSRSTPRCGAAVGAEHRATAEAEARAVLAEAELKAARITRDAEIEARARDATRSSPTRCRKPPPSAARPHEEVAGFLRRLDEERPLLLETAREEAARVVADARAASATDAARLRDAAEQEMERKARRGARRRGRGEPSDRRTRRGRGQGHARRSRSAGGRGGDRGRDRDADARNRPPRLPEVANAAPAPADGTPPAAERPADDPALPPPPDADSGRGHGRVGVGPRGALAGRERTHCRRSRHRRHERQPQPTGPTNGAHDQRHRRTATTRTAPMPTAPPNGVHEPDARSPPTGDIEIEVEPPPKKKRRWGSSAATSSGRQSSKRPGRCSRLASTASSWFFEPIIPSV